jgi:hypothetical protein
MAKDELLICRESFAGDFGNNDIYYGVKDKTIVDPATAEGKRVLRNWSKFFVPVGPSRVNLRSPVEQATAAPGEMRP